MVDEADFPLDAAMTSLWTRRADHQGRLGRHHLAQGDPVRAIDCLLKQLSLAGRLGDRRRLVTALLDLIEATAARGSPGDTTRYVEHLLTLAAEGPDAAALLTPAWARLDRILPAVVAERRLPLRRRALDAARPCPRHYALACCALARLDRSDGRPGDALRLLTGPLAWARETGALDAEVALRSEAAAALLASGEWSAAVVALRLNVTRLQASPGVDPAALATARRNLRAALGATPDPPVTPGVR